MITACDHLFDEYEDKRRTVLYGEVINREAFDLPLSGVSFCEKAKRVHDRIASEGTGFLDEKYPVLKRLGETLETSPGRKRNCCKGSVRTRQRSRIHFWTGDRSGSSFPCRSAARIPIIIPE